MKKLLLGLMMALTASAQTINDTSDALLLKFTAVKARVEHAVLIRAADGDYKVRLHWTLLDAQGKIVKMGTDNYTLAQFVAIAQTNDLAITASKLKKAFNFVAKDAGQK